MSGGFMTQQREQHLWLLLISFQSSINDCNECVCVSCFVPSSWDPAPFPSLFCFYFQNANHDFLPGNTTKSFLRNTEKTRNSRISHQSVFPLPSDTVMLLAGSQKIKFCVFSQSEIEVLESAERIRRNRA